MGDPAATLEAQFSLACIWGIGPTIGGVDKVLSPGVATGSTEPVAVHGPAVQVNCIRLRVHSQGTPRFGILDVCRHRV